jgi:hypothetical protein
MDGPRDEVTNYNKIASRGEESFIARGLSPSSSAAASSRVLYLEKWVSIARRHQRDCSFSSPAGYFPKQGSELAFQIARWYSALDTRAAATREPWNVIFLQTGSA